VPDLRAKILFTLFVIAVFRLGSYVPVPVVDIGILQNQADAGGFLNIINLFSGGALTRLSIFSLGIMPYITSSIIMQLMTVVIPKLQQWQEQGETGTKKINQWTRYVTVVLALLQSTGLVFLFHNPDASGFADVFPTDTFTGANVAFIVLIMTAGTAFIMWLGELITQRGVGNGMSILIFTSVISTLPAEGNAILQQGGTGKFAFIVLIGLGIIVAVIYVDQGQRRVPVQYAKRVVGRKMTSGGSTYLPLKVNQAGVIPIIFATSVLYFPALLVSVYHAEWFTNFVNNHVQNQASPVYMFLLAMLIIFFSYFYTAIQFDPTRTADNLRKNGGFIPGIRPGPPTADFLNRILIRIGLPGAIFLAVIALIPTFVLAFWGFQQFPFGGTSILIAVGVALETMKQIESQLLMRHYEGFLG
jgi:preprotein translocase subunit SecY